MIETIVYQSAVGSNNQAVQQISNLRLDGFVTVDGYANTDHGKLYASFGYSAGTYSLSIYRDSGKANLVASMTSSTSGLATISQAYASGISGTVNIIPGTAVADSNIVIVCLFSEDSDIPLDNLETISDYDDVYGFARFHQQSAKFVRDVIQSRYEDILWNSSLIDSSQINGGTGGYDLSRVLNWDHSDIREASAQYVLHLIARKQAIEPGGMFAEKAKCSYDRAVALLNSIEMSFDVDNTRVPRKTRANSTFKVGRA